MSFLSVLSLSKAIYAKFINLIRNIHFLLSGLIYIELQTILPKNILKCLSLYKLYSALCSIFFLLNQFFYFIFSYIFILNGLLRFVAIDLYLIYYYDYCTFLYTLLRFLLVLILYSCSSLFKIFNPKGFIYFTGI